MGWSLEGSLLKLRVGILCSTTPPSQCLGMLSLGGPNFMVQQHNAWKIFPLE